MSVTIGEAIARIPVLPGQPFRTRVNGQEIEIRVLPAVADFEETPTSFLWFDVPPSALARVLTVTRGPQQLPAPIQISNADVSPA